VLSGNVRDLQIHEPAPAQVTAAPVATILVDQLGRYGYQRIVTFDLVAGFRGLPASGTGTEGSDELLRTLGLLPSNGVAQGGVDLLAATLERFVTLDRRRFSSLILHLDWSFGTKHSRNTNISSSLAR
jgi:hypothetical protein